MLREYGYNVTARDIVQRTFELDGLWDFLQTTEKFDGDIVMNPPYKDALLHVNKALDICSGSVYALLKIQFLEGKSRYKELYSNGYLDHVYIFTGRTNCAKGNRFDEFTSSAVCYCWFKFNKHNKDKPTTISWVNT